METMTTEEFRKEQKKGRRRINVAEKSERFFNGILFDSKDEMRRYKHLLLLQKAGEISDLQCHWEFILQDEFIGSYSGANISEITYTADFRYIGEDGRCVVEDVKGFKMSKHKTPRKLPICNETFRLKRKLFMYKYPMIDFRVVDRDGDILL